MPRFPAVLLALPVAVALTGAAAGTAMATAPAWLTPASIGDQWTHTSTDREETKQMAMASSADGQVSTAVWVARTGTGVFEVFASRTTNGGDAWSTPVNISGDRTIDPHVADGATGAVVPPTVRSSADGSRVVVVWRGKDAVSGSPNQELRSAVFSGGSWGASAVITPSPSVNGKCFNCTWALAMTPDGTHAAVMWPSYASSLMVSEYRLVRLDATSTPTWSVDELVSATAQQIGVNVGTRPALAISDGGSVLTASWVAKSAYDNGVVYARRSRSVGTWDTPRAMGNPGWSSSAPVVVASADGNRAAFAWLKMLGGAGQVHTAQMSGADDASWAPPDAYGTLQSVSLVNVSGANRRSSSDIAMVGTPDANTLTLLWRDNSGSDNYGTITGRRYASGTWGPITQIGKDASGSYSAMKRPPALAQSSDGATVVATWAASAGLTYDAPRDIYVNHFGGGAWDTTGATAGTKVSSAASQSLRESTGPSLALTPDGSVAWVGWHAVNASNRGTAFVATGGPSQWSPATAVSAAASSSSSSVFVGYEGMMSNAEASLMAPFLAVHSASAGLAVWGQWNATGQSVQPFAARYFGATAPTCPQQGCVPTPSTGPVAGGTAITIAGNDLSGATVTVGGASAAVTANSATSVTFTSPPGTAGARDIVITTSDGVLTLPGAFTYVAPPADPSPVDSPVSDPSPTPAPAVTPPAAAPAAPVEQATVTSEAAAPPAPVRLSLRSVPTPAAPSSGAPADAPPTALHTVIDAPGPGTVRQVGSGLAQQQSREFAARRSPLCRGSVSVAAAGRVSVTCTLTPGARVALTRRALTLQVVTVFTGTDGATAQSVRRVVIPRAGRATAGQVGVTG